MSNKQLQKNSSDWLQVKLGDISDIYSGGTPDTSNQKFWNGEINWITPTEITKTGKYIELKTEKKITELGLKNSSAKLLPSGSLIICTRATVGECSISTYPISTNQGFKNLVPNKNTTVDYLYYFIKSIKPRLINLGSGSTFLEVSMHDIKKINLDLPVLIEQNRIVAVLETWDKEIEKLSKKIGIKKQIKKGLMQDLLTGKKSKKEWKKGILSDIFDFKKGSELSKEKLDNLGKFECILYGELYTTYNEVIYEIKSKTNFNEGTISMSGDILIPASTTTGAIDLAVASCLNKKDVLLGGDINILRPKDRIDSRFFAYYLTHAKKHDLARLAQGVTIVHLYSSDFKNIKIEIPNYKEQNEIANIITTSETEISVLEKKLLVLKEQKRYLLNNLITGTIRTPENLLEKVK